MLCRPPFANFTQWRIKEIHYLILYPIRNPICGFGNASGNRGKRITIPAEGDCIADGVLEIRAFKKSGNRLGDGVLTAFIVVVLLRFI